ncbi:hypothetical protein GALMADRAFT_147720 [Galerina marginata CBS 339.88]|uniref:Uncharacterized protein n=1 Tax=Galerina marginata (strain CBS 339.88) TaxID=685588 RepID=A0A067SIS4_GALM3|nr:hypothetical protein GALMADRAFT_147720 [Galerina marginata CBS 339.88]
MANSAYKNTSRQKYDSGSHHSTQNEDESHFFPLLPSPPHWGRTTANERDTPTIYTNDKQRRCFLDRRLRVDASAPASPPGGVDAHSRSAPRYGWPRSSIRASFAASAYYGGAAATAPLGLRAGGDASALVRPDNDNAPRTAAM